MVQKRRPCYNYARLISGRADLSPDGDFARETFQVADPHVLMIPATICNIAGMF